MQPFKRKVLCWFLWFKSKKLKRKQLLETISNRLAPPGMREAGSGPMSDKDLEVLKVQF